MINVRELIGERVLIHDQKGYYRTTVIEAKVLEVSPSGTWVKIMNMHGNKYWMETGKMSVIEKLEAKPVHPKEETDVK